MSSSKPKFRWDLRVAGDSSEGIALEWLSRNSPEWKRKSLDAVVAFWLPFALRAQEQEGEQSWSEAASSQAEAIASIQRLQHQIYLISQAFGVPATGMPFPAPPVPMPTLPDGAVNSPAPIPPAPQPTPQLAVVVNHPTAARELNEPETTQPATPIHISGFDDDLEALIAE